RTLGIERGMTNRALRALELLGGGEPITREAFDRDKFDVTYSSASTAAMRLAQLLQAPPPADALTRQALDVLRGWDRSDTASRRSHGRRRGRLRRAPRGMGRAGARLLALRPALRQRDPGERLAALRRSGAAVRRLPAQAGVARRVGHPRAPGARVLSGRGPVES